MSALDDALAAVEARLDNTIERCTQMRAERDTEKRLRELTDAELAHIRKQRDTFGDALRAIAAIGSERGTFDSIDAERAVDIATNALKTAGL